MSDLSTISAQLADLQRAMGRVEEKVSGVPELNKRVGRLEAWRNWATGIVFGVAAFIGYQAKGHL